MSELDKFAMSKWRDPKVLLGLSPEMREKAKRLAVKNPMTGTYENTISRLRRAQIDRAGELKRDLTLADYGDIQKSLGKAPEKHTALQDPHIQKKIEDEIRSLVRHGKMSLQDLGIKNINDPIPMRELGHGVESVAFKLRSGKVLKLTEPNYYDRLKNRVVGDPDEVPQELTAVIMKPQDISGVLGKTKITDPEHYMKNRLMVSLEHFATPGTKHVMPTPGSGFSYARIKKQLLDKLHAKGFHEHDLSPSRMDQLGITNEGKLVLLDTGAVRPASNYFTSIDRTFPGMSEELPHLVKWLKAAKNHPNPEIRQQYHDAMSGKLKFTGDGMEGDPYQPLHQFHRGSKNKEPEVKGPISKWLNKRMSPGEYIAWAQDTQRKALIGGGAAAGVGALGYGAYKAKEYMDQPSTPPAPEPVKTAAAPEQGEQATGDITIPSAYWQAPAAGVVGAVGTGVGAHYLDRAHNFITHTRRKIPRITVAGGAVTVPGFDAGAGHRAPAQAIYEGLQAHPEVMSGKVEVQGAFPENMQLANAKDFKNKSDLLITTGYSNMPGERYNAGEDLLKYLSGGVTEKYDKSPSPELSNHEATRQYQFLTDPPIDPIWGQGNLPLNFEERLALGKKYWPMAPHMTYLQFDPNIYRYGKSGHGWASKHMFDVHPGISDKAMAAAEKTLINPRPKEEVFKEYADQLRKLATAQAADPKTAEHAKKLEYTANYVEDALAKGKKLIVITGSSRGDNVTHNAIEITKALQKKGLQDHYAVIPMNGNNSEITAPLLEHAGLPSSRGRIDQDMYLRLRAAADELVSSTGASEIAETKMLPTRSYIFKNPRKLRLQEIENLDKHLKETTGKGLTPTHRQKLEAAMTELFNAGEFEELAKGTPYGMHMVDDAEHLVDVIAKGEHQLDPMHKQKLFARGHDFLVRHRAAKRKFADMLVQEAYAAGRHGTLPLFTRSPLRATALAGAGGVAAMGAYLGNRYLNRKSKENMAAQGQG